MSDRRGFTLGILFTVLLGILLFAGLKILLPTPAGGKSADPGEKPATVSKPLNEIDIGIITLREDPDRQTGIETAAVERKAVRRVRTYGGEVVVRAGHSAVVSAPLNGRLEAPGGTMPQPGETVKKGSEVFRFHPLLTPEGRATLATARIDAEGQVNNARPTLEMARIALERARTLVKDGSGSQRAVDEAQAQHDVATKTLDAAEARLDLLTRLGREIDKGAFDALTIDSPIDGLLRLVPARPGQVVPAGAPLFEVADLGWIWVRVPIYVGDLPEIDRDGTAAVSNLAADSIKVDAGEIEKGSPATFRRLKGDAGNAVRDAHPVPDAPPSADPQSGTVDLYYTMKNPDEGRLVPGERVAVTVALRDAADNLTVPWSAVIYDLYGGTWVYERTAERTYVRRRVEVAYVLDGVAVLASGPAQGSHVVFKGSAELFGTEVGFTK